ncbi:MAG: hypothetical protein HYV63_11210 [Candidatus Schekmanbacteria bacterium]|nr:hypothetical protein [Candidatus Schekmanbacteria bacterium]
MRKMALLGAATLLMASFAIACATGEKQRVSGTDRERVASNAPRALVPMKLVESFLTADVAQEANLAPRFGAPTETFTASTTEAIAVVAFENVMARHAVAFKWYHPDGDLYLDSGQTTIQPTGPYHRKGMVWHGMNIAGERASRLHGRWKVVVTLDEAVIATKSFEIGAARPQQETDQ